MTHFGHHSINTQGTNSNSRNICRNFLLAPSCCSSVSPCLLSLELVPSNWNLTDSRQSNSHACYYLRFDDYNLDYSKCRPQCQVFWRFHLIIPPQFNQYVLSRQCLKQSEASGHTQSNQKMIDLN